MMRRFESPKYDPEDFALRIQAGVQGSLPDSFVVSAVTVTDTLAGASIDVEARSLEIVGQDGEASIRIVIEALDVGTAEDLLLRVVDPIRE